MKSIKNNHFFPDYVKHSCFGFFPSKQSKLNDKKIL